MKTRKPNYDKKNEEKKSYYQLGK